MVAFSWPRVLLSAAASSALLVLLAHVVFGVRYRTPWSRALSGVLVGPLLVLAAIEAPAVFGFVDYRPFFSTPPGAWWNPRNRRDPELLHVHRAYDRFAGAVEGHLAARLAVKTAHRYPVDVQYDANGFRNPTDVHDADVVVVGDSFVEGYLVPFGQVVTSRLANMLGVAVLNLGQAGYGPQQELVVLRRYGFAVQPRVAVWVLFEGNDLDDYAAYPRLLARLQADRWWAPHEIAARSLVRNVLARLRRRAGLERQRVKVGLERSCLLGAAGGGERMFFGFDGGPLSARELASLDGAARVVDEASSASASRGVRFLLVLAPIKYRVYEGLCEIGGAGWQLGEVPDRLAAYAAAAGIPFLDLTPALRASVAAGDHPYFVDDSHWNAVGNEVAAREIAKAIRDRGWIGAHGVSDGRSGS